MPPPPGPPRLLRGGVFLYDFFQAECFRSRESTLALSHALARALGRYWIRGTSQLEVREKGQ